MAHAVARRMFATCALVWAAACMMHVAPGSAGAAETLAANALEPVKVAPDAGLIRLAQAGSAGGSVGKQNKSLSGEQESAPAPERPRAKPSARERTSPPRERSAAGNYDGTWTVVSVSPGCSSAPGIPGTGVVTISGGHISAQGLSGSVSSSGNSSSVYHGEGYISYASGRFSGRSGSGTFHTTSGCNGRWTAVKQ